MRALAGGAVLFGLAAATSPAQPNGSGAPGGAQVTDFLAEDVTPSVEAADLTRANKRKAEALAAFIEGAVAESVAETDKALSRYREVLNIDPGATVTSPNGEDLLLAVKVAYELARRGEVTEGIGILKDSIKAVPDDAIAYLYLAQLYARYLRKPDLALRYAKKAQQLDPGSIETYRTLFEIHLAANSIEEAEAALDLAARTETDDAGFWADLGELYRSFYSRDGYKREPADVEKMDRVVQQSLKFGAEDPDIAAKAADYYVLTERVEKAVPLYEDYVKANADSTEPASLDIRDKLGRSYLASGRREEAIKMYQAITRLNPLRYESYEMMGQLYQESSEWDRALSAYQQSLLLAPNQPMNYLRIAALQQEKLQFDKAAETLQEARRRFPDYPRIGYTLAHALSLAKRHSEAMNVYEEALHEAELSQDDMLDAEFYFNYGAAAEQAGFQQKAYELLKTSIDLDPASASRAYNYIGYMWVDSGKNLDEAGAMIRKALESEPENPAYLDSLGWYYFKKGEYARALPELLKAAESIEPEDPVVFDHLGDTYARLGNMTQALSYWQKAAELDGSDREIAAKIEKAKRELTALPPREQPREPALAAPDR